VIRKHNLKPAFYTINKTKNLFSHLKAPIPLLQKSGVYKLNCNDCPASYIGQTGRELKARSSEHKNVEKSAFAAHLCRHNHALDQVHFLHQSGKGKKLSALEDVEIIKAKFVHDCILMNYDVPSSPLADAYYAPTI